MTSGDEMSNQYILNRLPYAVASRSLRLWGLVHKFLWFLVYAIRLSRIKLMSTAHEHGAWAPVQSVSVFLTGIHYNVYDLWAML